jgi:hypothetical protein
MKIRFLLGVAVLLLALLLLFEAFDPAFSGRMSDLLLNVGTELIGIALTVVVIDILLEQRRLREEARRIATNVLNDLDHHVWVWQGGARGFDLAELSALLHSVAPDSSLPPFTQNLFLTLGSRSNNTLRTSPEVMAASPELRNGLEKLSELVSMRDTDHHMPPEKIAALLREALPLLTSVAGLIIPETEVMAPMTYRETTGEAQEWRHYGRR